MAGERSPGWQASATGVIDGLRLSTTSLDILQAALEGVALRLAIIAEQALTGASPATRKQPVIASGGALEASPVLGADVRRCAQPSAKPCRGERDYGARHGVLVLSALDGRALTDFPLESPGRLKPRPDAVEALRAARERQQALYRQFYGWYCETIRAKCYIEEESRAINLSHRR
ncbi:MAG: FGGY-family carbohydrate kinase [Anaerolineae bacterium]